MGIMAVRVALANTSRQASHREAPNVKRNSTSSRRCCNSLRNRSNPSEIPVSEFPNTMPNSGITTCGRYQGSGRTINSTVIPVTNHVLDQTAKNADG